MKISKAFLYLLLVLSSIAFVPKIANACDSCQGHNPGDTWTNAGRNYRCNSCNNVACTSGGVPSNRCEVVASGGICDNSCPYNAPGKYTVDLGAVAPSCTGVTAPTVNFNQDSGAYTMQANGVANTGSVWFHIWSPLNNKDDERILSATNMGGGVWRVTDQLELHPTNQVDNRIVADAYLGASAYAGGVYCGSVIGSFHKATPPTARLDFTWDTTGLELRDAFVNINDQINIADFPQTMTAIAQDTNTGNPQNGMSSMLVARRPCNATTSNCISGGGGWVAWNPSAYNCVYGSGLCSMTTVSWTPTMADLLTAARWEAVVNGYDIRGYQCSGNVALGSLSPFDSPYARCDRYAGLADKVNIYLNSVTRGSIDNGFLVNGVAQVSRNVSISAGDVLTLTVNGSDLNIDDAYAGNYVQYLRLYRSNPVFPVDIGTVACPAGSTTCANVFTYNTTGLPSGTYEIYVSTIDSIKPCNSEYNGGSWYNRTMAFHYRCDRNAASNYSTANDVITINVGPPKYTVSGSSFLTTTACTPRTGGPALGNISAVSANAYTGTFSGSSWSVPQVPQGTSITTMTSTMSPSGSNTYRLTCVDTDGIDGNGNEYSVSGGVNSISLGAGVTVNGNLNTWRLGFAQNNLPSWISVFDGDIYTNNGLTITIPGSPAGGFASYLLADTDSISGSGFVISNDTVSSNSLNQNNGGYINISNSVSSTLWPSDYQSTVPSSCLSNQITKTQLNSQLDPSRCYWMNTTDFNDWADDSGAAIYDLSSSDYVGVVYIGDTSGTSTLRIVRPIRSAAINERIVFVAVQNLVIDPTLGDLTPSPSGTPNLGAGFIALNDRTITITTQNPVDDLSLYINGFLYSKSTVDFTRNRQTANVYPSSYIRFNGQYLYGLTSRERNAASPNSNGLFVNNVSWVGN